MIIGIIIMEIILIGLMAWLFWYAEDQMEAIPGIIATIVLIICIALPFLVGGLHGYIDYTESNDKDKARITAVTQKQTAFKTYYKVEVEYLTNTPTQDGIVTNKNIEKDIFYCYYEDKELVNKLKENMYKELWIVSGYKGGYETYKDFGTKLIKDIELIESEER